MKIKNILISLWLISSGIFASDFPSPSEYLGFEVGSPRKLADMYQIHDYFQLLSHHSSRVSVSEAGKTTEGNPFIYAMISSPENLTHIEKYRKYQQLLSDPRKISDEQAEHLISSGKTIVMINCSLHATEIGASQMSLQLAYDLATKNDPWVREVLDNVILLLIPMHNPDGIQMVTDWYRKYVGTEYEGSRMPWLYHKYVGHDNNRDWYMFTQIESQLTLKIHNAWHPQIIVDMHQMGSRGARLFVPPYVDPYEPNVDPIIRQQVAAMGTFIASELTAEGKGGVMHSERFDAWTPARAYHHYHGGIRILTEAASVRIATPIKIHFEDLSNSVKKPSVKMPLVWNGGEWTLRDIIEYDYAAVRAALKNGARLRENWLRNFYRIHKKAVQRTEPPFAYLIPAEQKDLPTAIKMLKTLQMGGVEIHRSETDFSMNGDFYKSGTFIIYVNQPYGAYAKTLLEEQVYPEIRSYPGGPLKTPYDVVAHTLPLLMGVDVVQIDEPFTIKDVPVDTINLPATSFEPDSKKFGYTFGHKSNDDIVAMSRLLKKGTNVYWAAEDFSSDGNFYPAGTMILKSEKGLDKIIKTITKDHFVEFKSLTKKPDIKIYDLKSPRVGLFKPWNASMDEGWTRWVLEQYEIPFVNITNENVKQENLKEKFDVIIFSDIGEKMITSGMPKKYLPEEYAGGIGEAGIKNLKIFVKDGGTIITMNGSAGFAIKHFQLPVSNISKELRRNEFFIPGSILKARANPNHPIAYGYEKNIALFFRRSAVFEMENQTGVINYPDNDLLLSGWIKGEDKLYGKSALLDIPFGEGKIILIGFPALYRAQSHATFRLLFNSIYYGPAKLSKF